VEGLAARIGIGVGAASVCALIWGVGVPIGGVCAIGGGWTTGVDRRGVPIARTSLKAATP
jgi:hypothetical protein